MLRMIHEHVDPSGNEYGPSRTHADTAYSGIGIILQNRKNRKLDEF